MAKSQRYHHPAGQLLAALALGLSLAVSPVSLARAEELVQTEDPVPLEDPAPIEEPSQAIDLSSTALELEADRLLYTGEQLTPGAMVCYVKGQTLVILIEGTDYTVSYADNAEVGTATVTATAIEGSGYTGSISKTFQIIDPATRAQVAEPVAADGLVYSGHEQQGVSVGEDYLLEGASATDAGTYTAVASLADPVASVWADGTTEPKELTYTIQPASLADARVTLKWSSCTYKGDAKKPAVTSAVLALDGTDVALAAGSDYTVSYENNVNAGTAKVIITGTGNYTGTASADLTIKQASISKGTFKLKWDSCTYKGDAKKPALKTATVTFDGKAVSLKSGTDYTLSYKNNVNAGTATVVITGKGNYTGTVNRKLTIKKASFGSASCSVGAQLYTGKALKPVPTVKWGGKTLKNGTDFSLSYKNNTKVGKATVTITAKGNFTGKKSLTFTIYQRKMSDASVEHISAKDYTGSGLTPSPKVTYKGKTLKRGTDYTVSYKNNRYGGWATVTITGKGSYKGSTTTKFWIEGPTYRGRTVYITNTGTKYHRNGCRYLKSKHAVDLGVALYEGYEPCKVCRP